MTHFLCPVWAGYILASPIRKLIHNPHTILEPYLKPAMTVLDVGSAMGFFSIPAAQMVGKSGRVICVDCQPKMLSALKKRAAKAQVLDTILMNPCSPDNLCVDKYFSQVDVAIAFAVLHEMKDPNTGLAQIASTLKPKGLLLYCEPKGHVPLQEIQQTVKGATRFGLTVSQKPQRLLSHMYVFTKN